MTSSDEVARIVSLDDATVVQPEEYRLGQDLCTIGRALTCHIVVQRSDISRLHARIERDGHRYVLRDAESANGTFVNGRSIHKPHLLKHYDVIGLGAALELLRFLDPDPTTDRGGRLRYDDDRMAFFLGDQQLPLTPNEQRLLTYLYQHRAVVCRYDRCAEAIWGAAYEPGRDSRLDGVIRDIRNKLRTADPVGDELLKTHKGKGYELLV